MGKILRSEISNTFASIAFVSKHFPRVGVIGAGQLARMMAVPANDLGIDFLTLANSNSDSAAQVSPFVVGDYKSETILENFAKDCDLVTFEHHELAKRAKDAGAALVFVSFFMMASIWILTLLNHYSK